MRISLALSIMLLVAGPTRGDLENEGPGVLLLQGSAYERGLTHGKALRNEINEIVRLWKADLAARFKMDADAFITRFLARTRHVDAIRRWTPELLDEVRGIAEGSGIGFDTMLVFQLVDECWASGGAIAREHCSGLGIARRAEHPSIIAQNMDLEGFRQGFQVVLHIREPASSLEAYIPTCAGLIALNGVNSRGIGVCVNTLLELEPCRDGLPVACVIRGVLLQETEEAAVNFLTSVKHASGQNYIIGGPTRVRDFECSANRVVEFVPKDLEGVVYHTNHVLASDDLTPEARKQLATATAAANPADNSHARLDSVRMRLSTLREPGVAPIREILSSHDSADHPVCRRFQSRTSGFTFECSIMVLGVRSELHFSPGPPDSTPFRVLTFAGRSR